MALTAVFINQAKTGRGPVGKHFDSGRLILRIKQGGRASWVFRYDRKGKRQRTGRRYSVRTFPSPTPARPRPTIAARWPKMGYLLREKRARRAADVMTFEQAVTKCVEDRKTGWKNGKMKQEWLATLGTYANPIIGRLAVADVDTRHVVDVLKPIWTTVPPTAGKLRGRIESVLDWAKLHGHRDGENPARWRGHLAADVSRHRQGAAGRASQGRPHPLDCPPRSGNWVRPAPSPPRR